MSQAELFETMEKLEQLVEQYGFSGFTFGLGRERQGAPLRVVAVPQSEGGQRSAEAFKEKLREDLKAMLIVSKPIGIGYGNQGPPKADQVGPTKQDVQDWCTKWGTAISNFQATVGVGGSDTKPELHVYFRAANDRVNQRNKNDFERLIQEPKGDPCFEEFPKVPFTTHITGRFAARPATSP